MTFCRVVNALLSFFLGEEPRFDETIDSVGSVSAGSMICGMFPAPMPV